MDFRTRDFCSSGCERSHGLTSEGRQTAAARRGSPVLVAASAKYDFARMAWPLAPTWGSDCGAE